MILTGRLYNVFIEIGTSKYRSSYSDVVDIIIEFRVNQSYYQKTITLEQYDLLNCYMERSVSRPTDDHVMHLVNTLLKVKLLQPIGKYIKQVIAEELIK